MEGKTVKKRESVEMKTKEGHIIKKLMQQGQKGFYVSLSNEEVSKLGLQKGSALVSKIQENSIVLLPLSI